MSFVQGTQLNATPSATPILLDDNVPYASFSVEANTRRVKSISMSMQTYLSFLQGQHEFDVLQDLDEIEVDGPMVRTMVESVGSWSKAVESRSDKRESQIEGAAEELKRDVLSFVERVGTMRSAPTPSQAAALGDELGSLRDRHARLIALLQESEELLSFGAVALSDTLGLEVRP